MDERDGRLLLTLLVVAAVAGAGWYFRDKFLPQAEQPVVIPPESAEPEAGVDESPKYPIAPPEATDSAPKKLIPLPPLDDSDAYFLLALIDVFGADVEMLLVKEGLIDKFVATVDNLPRGHVAEKVRPVGRLSEPFRVESAGPDKSIYVSPDNFKRYDALVTQIATADLDVLVGTYRRFYPLFQESYQRLGYPDAYFNDRVVEVIDHILATPEPDEPLQLVQPHVLYEFADPELEALSSGQKLLLRMGSSHAATVRRRLADLRARLVQQ